MSFSRGAKFIMYFYETIKQKPALTYGYVKARTVESKWRLQWCASNTAYDKLTPSFQESLRCLFQDGYDQHLTRTTWVARSKEPSLSKVQFVAILIRILDLIKYGYFL